MNVLNEDAISIRFDDTMVRDCSSVIIVPERALSEAGFIKTLTAGDLAYAKHEFHAMAQMAFYQFQDGELEMTEARSAISITCRREDESLTAGMVIYRDGEGNFHLLAHKGQNAKKLLEAANRFCTRWVRLDI
jgi:hypothetical protein